MSFFADLMGGGVEGLAKGVGQFAKDIRTAITGKEPLTAEQQAAILARADALEAAAQAMETQAAAGQIDLNKLDAQSGNAFKGGWRPFIGWVCAAGLAYTFVVKPLGWWCVQTYYTVRGENVLIPAMPTLDTVELMALTMSLLGFGGYRMYERISGKA